MKRVRNAIFKWDEAEVKRFARIEAGEHRLKNGVTLSN